VSTPQVEFNREEFTLEISGLTGGWTFGHLGELRLFDHAQLQFPHDWDEFKVGAATHVIETTWHLNARTLVESTLSAGIDYSRADGVSGNAAMEAALLEHLVNRPTVSLDLRLTVSLEGTANSEGFSGTPHFGLGLSGRF
jgi:hypothetical protein